MLIRCNNYQLKDIEWELFRPLYEYEFPITFVSVYNSKVIFSSRNELFSLTSYGIKKLASADSDITTLSVQDGLIIVGSHSGAIQVLADMKSPIRRYSLHEAAVKAIRMYTDAHDKRVIASASEDGRVLFYNLTDDCRIKSLSLGSNYVNSLAIYGSILYTGAKSIRGYSLLNFEEVFRLDCEMPVCNLCVVDAGAISYTSGIRLYVVNLGDKSVISSVVHSKRILSCIYHSGVFYTLGEDGHLKSLSRSLQRISDFNFRGRVSSLAIDNGGVFVASCNSIYGLEEREPDKPVEKREKTYKKRAYEEEIEYKTVGSNKRRMGDIEGLLTRYEYKKAVKIIMERNCPEQSFSVLQYLHDQRALKKALGDENSQFVGDFIDFCVDHFSIREFTDILAECLIIMTSLYGEMLTQDDELRSKMLLLSEIIDEEVAYQEVNWRSIAFLESFPAVKIADHKK